MGGTNNDTNTREIEEMLAVVARIIEVILGVIFAVPARDGSKITSSKRLQDEISDINYNQSIWQVPKFHIDCDFEL